MKKLCAFLAAAGILAVSCSKSPEPESTLGFALTAALQRPPCSGVIPGNWTASIPVPVAGSQGREFAVFFYALPDRASDAWLGTPSGRAVISLDSNSALSCARGAGSAHKLGLVGRFSPAALALGVDGLDKKRVKLYAAAERAGALYAADDMPVRGAAGRAPNSRELAQLKSFADSFALLAEPPFLRDYYRLNPDFWKWLKRQGIALPKGLSAGP